MSMKSVKTPGGIITCSPPCWPTSSSGICRYVWGKKAPAITLSQLRTLLEVVLPLKTLTMAAVLQLVSGRQQRHHRAFLSHRTRRRQPLECPQIDSTDLDDLICKIEKT